MKDNDYGNTCKPEQIKPEFRVILGRLQELVSINRELTESVYNRFNTIKDINYPVLKSVDKNSEPVKNSYSIVDELYGILSQIELTNNKMADLQSGLIELVG